MGRTDSRAFACYGIGNFGVSTEKKFRWIQRDLAIRHMESGKGVDEANRGQLGVQLWAFIFKVFFFFFFPSPFLWAGDKV